MRRSLAIVVVSAGAVVAAALLLQRSPACSQGQPASRPNAAFLLVMGLKDTVPAQWGGSLRAEGARVAALTPFRFTGRDRLQAEEGRWSAGTALETTTLRRPFDQHLPALPTSPLCRPGVLGELEAGPDARVSVATPAGEFSFRPAALAPGRPMRALDGAAEVHALPVAERLSARGAQDDHPAIVAAGGGSAWVVWVSYENEGDRVLARRFDGGRWSDPQPLTEAPGDHFRPALGVAGGNTVWAVWSAREGQNWDLYGRAWSGGRWGRTQRLTQDSGPDLFPALAADRSGRLHLAWQGFRDGQADVLVSSLQGDRWSPPLRVSPSPANDWEPAIACGPDGRAHVAWDSYDQGNYDVLLRTLEGGRLSPVIAVAQSERFEAHATVAVDARNRVWVAWDEAGPNWGKDTGFMWEINRRPQGARLYEGRRVGVAVLDGEKRLRPATDINTVPAAGQAPAYELPHLEADARGRVSLFLRRKTLRSMSVRGVGRSGVWEFFVTRPEGSGWLSPAYLPYSPGRNDMRVAASPDADGGVWTAWAGDGRNYPGPEEGDLEVYAARVRLGEEGDAPALVPREDHPAAVRSIHPGEPASVARLRAYRLEAGGRTYRILRGDMHRHTDISSDGGGDGSLMDAFRYALDAAAFDYLAVTDHNAGDGKEYPWWRTQKATDLFLVPGAFVPLFAYERSLSYPNGHRNVVHAQRGVRVLPFAAGERGGQANTGPALYPHLRETRGIAMSHTSATGMGTDWRDNDPALEPLVEIFQGDRTNYECEGAPLAATSDKPGIQEGGFRPAGFVWNALRKGYRLGFQASSDHLSTHLSYACLLVTDFTREGMMDAIRRRHAYAATDNILMDVRLAQPDAQAILGDEVTTAAAPKLVVKIEGTGELKRVDVVRDGAFAFTRDPEGSAFEFTYSDPTLSPGETAYYYVRALQDDGQVAWASPIWVTRK